MEDNDSNAWTGYSCRGMSEGYTRNPGTANQEEGYEPIEGTLDLIRELHSQGIPLAVASSSSKQEIERVMDYFEITHCFRALVSGKDCEHPKPAPDVILKAARKLCIKPEQCLVIEDSNNGVTAAKSAGMSVIGFRNLEVANQELRPADHVVTSNERHYSGIVQKFLKIYIGKLNLSKDVWGDLVVTKL